MIDFGSWLASDGDDVWIPGNVESERASLAWKRINDKSSSVTFKKPDDTTLAAQTVRLESDSSATIAESSAGAAPRRKITIFGIRNHATETDTDIGEGYRFVIDDDEYIVIDVVETLGEIQGVAESNG